MSDLRALYQEMILDHYKKPRNFGPLPEPVRKAEGNNPLCGDQIRVFVDLDDDTLERVSFEGHGCAISTASASLMSEIVTGRSRQDAEELGLAFRRAVTSGEDRDEGDAGPELGKLEVLLGVRAYPVRIKCATLAWHALNAALNADPGDDGDIRAVTTE